MKTLLIVDDESVIRSLYKEEFEENGYKVLLADGAKKALALLKDNKIDCIILDIKMPEIDGLKLLNTIRQENRSIRIVINSAYSHYRQDFSAWGADEYIVKSSDLTELKDTIERLLE